MDNTFSIWLDEQSKSSINASYSVDNDESENDEEEKKRMKKKLLLKETLERKQLSDDEMRTFSPSKGKMY